MSLEHLSVYLNDHLAGSSAALTLLDELGRLDGFGDWTGRLRSDIEQDREELEVVMRNAQIPQSTPRQAAGWLSAKLIELKTRLDDRTGGDLHQLELIEALALGIEGKRALWTALQAVAAHVPALQSLDYARLLERAAEQRRTVEVHRLAAAARAFGPPRSG